MGQEESVSKGKLADSSLASIPNSALKGAGSFLQITFRFPFLFRLDLLVFSCSKSWAFVLLRSPYILMSRLRMSRSCCWESWSDARNIFKSRFLKLLLYYLMYTVEFVAQSRYCTAKLHTFYLSHFWLSLEQSTNHEFASTEGPQDISVGIWLCYSLQEKPLFLKCSVVQSSSTVQEWLCFGHV